MNDKEIIEALIANEKPFGLMSEDMQAKAREIGHTKFECYENTDKFEWGPLAVFPEYNFGQAYTYRLRPDYEEKPEIVECEVKLKDGISQFERIKDSHCWYGLHASVNMPDFIGFKYEGSDSLWALTRLYRNKETGELFTEIPLEDLVLYEVLTPTHVLFQVTK